MADDWSHDWCHEWSRCIAALNNLAEPPLPPGPPPERPDPSLEVRTLGDAEKLFGLCVAGRSRCVGCGKCRRRPRRYVGWHEPRTPSRYLRYLLVRVIAREHPQWPELLVDAAVKEAMGGTGAYAELWTNPDALREAAGKIAPYRFTGPDAQSGVEETAMPTRLYEQPKTRVIGAELDAEIREYAVEHAIEYPEAFDRLRKIKPHLFREHLAEVMPRSEPTEAELAGDRLLSRVNVHTLHEDGEVALRVAAKVNHEDAATYLGMHKTATRTYQEDGLRIVPVGDGPDLYQVLDAQGSLLATFNTLKEADAWLAALRRRANAGTPAALGSTHAPSGDRYTGGGPVAEATRPEQDSEPARALGRIEQRAEAMRNNYAKAKAGRMLGGHARQDDREPLTMAQAVWAVAHDINWSRDAAIARRLIEAKYGRPS